MSDYPVANPKDDFSDLPLFSERPLRRNVDPPSSFESAADVAPKVNGLCALCLESLKEMVSTFGIFEANADGRRVEFSLGQSSYSSNEISIYCLESKTPKTTRETLRRRVADLKKKGQILIG